MNLFERVKNILLSPAKEWEVVKAEQATVADLFTKYAMILAAIPAIAGFIGYSVFGISLGIFGSYRVPIGTGILWAVLTYVLSLVGVFVIGFIIDALATSFGSTKDLTQSMKVAVYSYTASWIGGIFMIFPTIGFLAGIAGIYSLVLIYMGLQRVKDVPKDKMVGYFVVTLILAIVVYFVIGAITGAIAFSGMALGNFDLNM
ncbi:MAG: Yip1 family protein [bacterium]